MLKKYFARKELFYLAALGFSISFAFNFQLSNLSCIFKFLGAHAHELPFLWLAPPLTGLIIQPLIGQMSDNSVNRFGKRTPYIIGGGILAAMGFLIEPFFNSLLIAVLLTWLIDCSLNAATETMRALTTDLTNKQERAKAFTLQALFGGIGAGIGTSLPYITHKFIVALNLDKKLASGEIPLNLKISFGITALVIILTSIIFIRNVKEKTLKHHLLLKKKQPSAQWVHNAFVILKDLYFSITLASPTFKRYCVIHATAWIGVFIFWLYFSISLAQTFYGLKVTPNLPTNLQATKILQYAALDTSIYFSFYQYISVGYTVLLFFLLDRTEKIKQVHAISLFMGGIGMILACTIPTTLILFISMFCIGIMWGSMMVIPYTIVSEILPKRKLGVYLGIFNISITLPQIICSLILSPIYIYIFKGHANYLLILAGLFISVSAYFWLKEANSEDLEKNMDETEPLAKPGNMVLMQSE